MHELRMVGLAALDPPYTRATATPPPYASTVFSPFSSNGTRLTATSVSSSSRLMILTPCVLRPMMLTSLAANPLDLAAGGHHQQLVLVAHADDADHRPVALGGLDVAQALAAAALRAVACAARSARLRRPRLRLGVRVRRRLGSFGRFRRRRRPSSSVLGAASSLPARPPGWGRRASACRSRCRKRSAAWPRDRPRPCPPRWSSATRLMPFTPLELRPMGRASDWLEADGHAVGGGQHAVRRPAWSRPRRPARRLRGA